MSVQTEPSSIAITLPEFSSKVLDYKPSALSGICPTKAFLCMLGLSVAFNLVLGFLAHYGGVALNWLGVNLGIVSREGIRELLLTFLEVAAVCALCAGIGTAFVLTVSRGIAAEIGMLVGIGVGLVTFLSFMLLPIIILGMGFIYCVVIGALCALITINQGVRSHCRNIGVYAGVGALSGAITYGVHILLVLLQGRDFYPIGLPLGASWLVGAIEAVLVVAVAAALSPSIVARLRYCETHSVWYDRKWKQGRIFANQEMVNAVYQAIESQSVEGLEGFASLSEETCPFLVFKARGCPKNGCDVELLATLYYREKDSQKKRLWFRILVPGTFGKEFIKSLNLQTVLPPLKKQQKPTPTSGNV